MLRFISFLLGKPYETCKSCETLKQQLDTVNAEKKELLDTLMSLIKPKVYEAPPQELEPVIPKTTMWARRRALLEEQAKVKADRERSAAKPDNLKEGRSVADIEEELGVNENAS